jgi:hypothetical protein
LPLIIITIKKKQLSAVDVGQSAEFFGH